MSIAHVFVGGKARASQMNVLCRRIAAVLEADREDCATEMFDF
jgi:hypothetical protein